MLLRASLTFWQMATIRWPFSGQLITSKFLFNTDDLSLIFHLDCTRRWRFTLLTHALMLVRRYDAVGGELHQLCDYIIIVMNPYMWLMVWQWCHFLVASNKTGGAEKWCKFSSHVKVKSWKKEVHKKRPSCILFASNLHSFLYLCVHFSTIVWS